MRAQTSVAGILHFSRLTKWYRAVNWHFEWNARKIIRTVIRFHLPCLLNNFYFHPFEKKKNVNRISLIHAQRLL